MKRFSQFLVESGVPTRTMHAGVVMSKGTMGTEKHKVIRWQYEHPHTSNVTQPDGEGYHAMHPNAVAHTIDSHPDVKKAKAEGYHQVHTHGMVSLHQDRIDDMVEEHRKRYNALYKKDPEMAK